MADPGEAARHRSSTSASRSRRRAAIPTTAPAAAKPSASPAPMPEDPPVMRTRFPSNGDGSEPGIQRFFHSGVRFSAKARGPSTASSLENTSEEMEDSIR